MTKEQTQMMNLMGEAFNEGAKSSPAGGEGYATIEQLQSLEQRIKALESRAYRIPECTLQEMRERVKKEKTYPTEVTIITYATEDE